MPTTLEAPATAEKPLDRPKKSISLEGTEGKRSPAHRIFDSIREQIATVFPNDDQEAWTRTTEDFEEISIEPPADKYNEWFQDRYEGSDDFSKLFTRRMFMVWDELEKNGFIANDKELWEHQKALFAWATLNICTGSREEMASLLIRSPYGSGKSLVSGLIARAFRDAQLDLMLLQKVDPTKIPTAASIGMKMEHMIDNAVGDQFSVLQPPYNVERVDMNQYWKDFAARFQEKFTNIFKKPTKANDPFYTIFRSAEEGKEEETTVHQKIDAYLQEVGMRRKKGDAAMLDELQQLASGEIVFIPDEENMPQPHPAQLREEHVTEECPRFRGDSAHAIEERRHYHVITSHKHLAPNPASYSTEPDPEAQFAIVSGTALTRMRLRKDMDKFAQRCQMLLLDEAYKLNPGTVGYSVSQNSGKWPIVVGLTAQDMGIVSWEASPSISQATMIKLGLMKPIAYTTIGSVEDPPSPGSEEAWDEYEKSLFEDYQTAEALGIKQPHELDTVTIVKTSRVHEYARRIRLAHKERDIPVEVYVYHSDAGHRKISVLNAFKAPKQKGSPRRIMVATEDIAFAHTIPNAHCYDFADDISLIAKEQATGRLGHVRNDAKTTEENEVARTYVREQHFHKGKNLYVREAAEQNGYTVPDEGATWVPLHNMIDGTSYDLDEEWNGLGKPVEIADTPNIRRRKQRKKGRIPDFVGTPLTFTNPHAAEKEKRRLERRRRQIETREARQAPLEVSQPSYQERQLPLNTQTYTGQQNGESLTITVGPDGKLTEKCYEELKMRAPSGYEGSLGARIFGVQMREGKRGKELAVAIIGQMNELRRKSIGHSQLDTGGERTYNIGVKYRGKK